MTESTGVRRRGTQLGVSSSMSHMNSASCRHSSLHFIHRDLPQSSLFVPCRCRPIPRHQPPHFLSQSGLPAMSVDILSQFPSPPVPNLPALAMAMAPVMPQHQQPMMTQPPVSMAMPAPPAAVMAMPTAAPAVQPPANFIPNFPPVQVRGLGGNVQYVDARPSLVDCIWQTHPTFLSSLLSGDQDGRRRLPGLPGGPQGWRGWRAVLHRFPERVWGKLSWRKPISAPEQVMHHTGLAQERQRKVMKVLQ